MTSYFPLFEFLFQLSPFRRRDAIQVLPAPQEKFFAHDRRRRIELVVQLVRRKHFGLVALLQHHCAAIAANEINTACRANGRCINAAHSFEALGFHQRRAVLRIENGKHRFVAFEKIKPVIVEQWRRHIRGVLVVSPGYCIGASEIAGASELHGKERKAAKAAHGINHSVPGDGTRNDVRSQRSDRPKLLAAHKIVTAHLAARIDDHLRGSALLKDQWRTPTGGLFALLPPQFVAGLFVKGHDEVLAEMVPVHYERVFKKCRGTPFTEAHDDFHFAEVLLPLHVAIEVETVKSARSEASDDILAIGNRRLRSERAVAGLRAFVWNFFTQCFLPKRFAGRAVHRDHDKLIWRSRRAAHPATTASARTTGLSASATRSEE